MQPLGSGMAADRYLAEWLPAYLHPLAGRPASPESLPGLKPAESVEDAIVKKQRGANTKYGGDSDRAHLGGFTDLDPDGISPAAWRFMMQNLTVQSLVDVGCGKGVSTSWFAAHGADVLCVEGSSDAVAASRLPRDRIVEHDFSRGPWWPNNTYDAAWSVEFIEHVGRPFISNYLPIFESAALLFVSGSKWGGWHHVEVHEPDWWIARFTAAGFVHSPDLTKRIHEAAQGGRYEKSADGKTSYRAQHIWLNMQVFLNPPVLRLQKHAHLWGEPGCFGMKIGKQQQLGRWCGHHGTIGSGVTQADRLPKRWMPLQKAFKSDAEVGWEPPPCNKEQCP